MSLDCKWDLDRHTSDTVNYLKLSNGRVSFLSLSHFVSKAHSHEQHTMAKHLNLRSVNFLVWLRVLKNFRRPSICSFRTPIWLSSNIWSLMFGMSIVTWRLIDWYSWLNVTHWNSPFFNPFPLASQICYSKQTGRNLCSQSFAHYLVWQMMESVNGLHHMPKWRKNSLILIRLSIDWPNGNSIRGGVFRMRVFHFIYMRIEPKITCLLVKLPTNRIHTKKRRLLSFRRNCVVAKTFSAIFACVLLNQMFNF